MPRSNQEAQAAPRRNLRNGSGRRSLRRPIQIGLLALLLVDLLFFVLAFRPAGQSIAEQRQGLERLRADLEQRRAAVERLHAIEANLTEARRGGEDFYRTRFLPKAIGFSVIVEELDKLASANGVRKGPVGYNLAEVKGRSDLEAVEITTSLEGDYAKILQFINRLEQSPLFLIVDSLAAGSGTAVGPRSGVRLAVRVVTYFRVTGRL